MKKIKGYIKIFLQKLRRIDYIIFYSWFKCTSKVNENKILFLSDSRSDLSGNFEFVYNEIIKDKEIYNFDIYKRRINSTLMWY